MRSYKRRAIRRNSKSLRPIRRALEPLENRLYLSGETGLRADFYNAASSVFSANTLAVTTTPVVTQTDSTVDFNWNGAAPLRP